MKFAVEFYWAMMRMKSTVVATFVAPITKRCPSLNLDLLFDVVKFVRENIICSRTEFSADYQCERKQKRDIPL